MRILGLDVGSKTIGVAISDPLGWTAQGIDTIRRKNKKNRVRNCPVLFLIVNLI